MLVTVTFPTVSVSPVLTTTRSVASSAAKAAGARDTKKQMTSMLERTRLRSFMFFLRFRTLPAEKRRFLSIRRAETMIIYYIWKRLPQSMKNVVFFKKTELFSNSSVLI